MGTLYSRVFVQILDSSIAEDFLVRHVFEDLMKVCDRTGVVDMTRWALARRFNMPLPELNRCLAKLEQPDEASRDPEFDGRRLERLDQHRDWGWRILNFSKYEEVRTRADLAERVQRHRDRQKAAGGEGGAPTGRSPRENRPRSIEEVMEYGAMNNVPATVCREFWEKHEEFAQPGREGELSVWMSQDKDNPNGESPVRNWRMLLRGWGRSDEARKFRQRSKNAVRQEESNRALLEGAKHVDTSHGTNQRNPNPAAAFGSG